MIEEFVKFAAMEVKTYKSRSKRVSSIVDVLLFDGTNTEQVKEFCGENFIAVVEGAIVIQNWNDVLFNDKFGPKDIVNGNEVLRYPDTTYRLKPGEYAVRHKNGNVRVLTGEELDARYDEVAA